MILIITLHILIYPIRCLLFLEVYVTLLSIALGGHGFMLTVFVIIVVALFLEGVELGSDPSKLLGHIGIGLYFGRIVVVSSSTPTTSTTTNASTSLVIVLMRRCWVCCCGGLGSVLVVVIVGRVRLSVKLAHERL